VRVGGAQPIDGTHGATRLRRSGNENRY